MPDLYDFHARRLVEATAHAVFGHLLMISANEDESFRQSAEVYLRYGQSELDKIESYINRFQPDDLALYMGCPRTEA